MVDPTTKITLGAFTLYKPSSARVLQLVYRSTTNAYHTFELNGVDYQVPVGKKLWIFHLISQCPNAGLSSMILYQTDAADSSTGAVQKGTLLYTNAIAEFPLGLIEIAATKYPTVNIPTVDAYNQILLCLELDA